jgi:heme/copper-type cytochrome/quinol oxidase subunit 4
MFVIIGKLVLSVILTIVALAAVMLGFYWFLLFMTILTGLMGMQVVSLWFRTKMDSLTARVKRVFSTIKGKK